MTRVLVVDDDVEIRRLLEMSLSDYQIVFASDGQEALEQLARQKVDVVVLDVMMPRIDGLETLRRIRLDEKLKLLPVVMLTARAAEDDHFRGFAYGADAYLTKPFDPDELVRTVEMVRERPSDMRERIREQEKAKAALLRQLERRFQ